MKQVSEFFEQLFSADGWPARWYCGNWSGFHGWLYIASDLAIWAAYFTIPVLLILFIKKKSSHHLPTVFWLFGAFILFCGLTRNVFQVLCREATVIGYRLTQNPKTWIEMAQCVAAYP